MTWLSLSIGGLAGVFARYFLANAIAEKTKSAFPFGTLAVNLSGCLLIGFLAALAREKGVLGLNERLLLMTGFCGAYTTFSAFMLETSRLASDRELTLAFLNVLISVVLGFLLFRIGLRLGRLA